MSVMIREKLAEREPSRIDMGRKSGMCINLGRDVGKG